MSIAVEPEATRLTATIGDKEISFETGAVAKQAHGAVLVRAAGPRSFSRPPSVAPKAREGTDFFPLTVDIEEKMYAAGKIPGGFFKREGRGRREGDPDRADGRPADPAALAEGLPNEVQIIGTVLSVDGVHRARHPGHQRRVGGADALADAVPRPGGRRPHRPHRRRARGQSDADRTWRSPRSTSSSAARPRRSRWSRPAPTRSPRRSARGARAGPRRDQHAVPASDRARGKGGQAQVAGRRRRPSRCAGSSQTRSSPPSTACGLGALPAAADASRRRARRLSPAPDRVRRPPSPAGAVRGHTALGEARDAAVYPAVRPSSATPSARCPTPSRTPRS